MLSSGESQQYDRAPYIFGRRTCVLYVNAFLPVASFVLVTFKWNGQATQSLRAKRHITKQLHLIFRHHHQRFISYGVLLGVFCVSLCLRVLWRTAWVQQRPPGTETRGARHMSSPWPHPALHSPSIRGWRRDGQNLGGDCADPHSATACAVAIIMRKTYTHSGSGGTCLWIYEALVSRRALWDTSHMCANLKQWFMMRVCMCVCLLFDWQVLRTNNKHIDSITDVFVS